MRSPQIKGICGNLCHLRRNSFGIFFLLLTFLTSCNTPKSIKTVNKHHTKEKVSKIKNTEIKLYASGVGIFGFETNLILCANRIDYNNISYTDFINKKNPTDYEKYYVNILKGLASDKKFDSSLLDEKGNHYISFAKKYISKSTIINTLKIKHLFFLGDDVCFIASIIPPESKKNIEMIISALIKIKPKLSLINNMRPKTKEECCKLLIDQALQFQITNGNTDFKFSNQKCHKENEIVLIPHKMNPVSLKFNYKKYDKYRNILDQSIVLKDPILKFLRNVSLSLKDGTLDDYYKHFTLESSRKLKKMLNSYSSKELKDFRKYEQIKRGKYISFVIDAEPLYICYLSDAKRKYHRKYILKTGEDYKIIYNPCHGWLEALLDDYLSKEFAEYIEKKELTKIKEE